MTQPGYPAARAAAARILAHLERHLAAFPPQQGRKAAAAPDTTAIEAIIQAAFWASLRREEGYMPKISLAFVSPTEAVHPLQFERPLPLAPAALTRVAPAVERAGIHLAVWRDGDGWTVWGTVRAI